MVDPSAAAHRTLALDGDPPLPCSTTPSRRCPCPASRGCLRPPGPGRGGPASIRDRRRRAVPGHRSVEPGHGARLGRRRARGVEGRRPRHPRLPGPDPPGEPSRGPRAPRGRRASLPPTSTPSTGTSLSTVPSSRGSPRWRASASGYARGTRAKRPPEWSGSRRPPAPSWAVDPLAVDSAFQLGALVVWDRYQRAGTPVAVRRLVQLADAGTRHTDDRSPLR